MMPATSASKAKVSQNIDDPFNLQRFVEMQNKHYSSALKEIHTGRKQGHWIWYIIPTPPYEVNGVEQGSQLNRYYALRSDEEATKFLRFKASGVDLRANYIEIMTAVRDQLKGGISAGQLMGTDDSKLQSSAQYFAKVTDRGSDEEVHKLCAEVVSLIGPRSAAGCCLVC